MTATIIDGFRMDNFHEYSVGQGLSVIFNKLTGALVLADSKFWKDIPFDSVFGIGKGSKARLSTQEFQTLDDVGFMLNEGRIEALSEKIRQFSRDKKQTRPTTFFITPQLTCPMGCIYCFEENDRKRQGVKGKLSVEDIPAIKNSIESYRKLYNLSSKQIALSFFGGEPLIPELKEFNVGLFELANKEGFWVDIVTSGVSIDDFYQGLLAENIQIIREINVTVDGPKDIHDSVRPLRNGAPSYELIAKNIQKMLDNKVRVLLKENFGSKTVGGFEQFIDDINSYGWYDSKFFAHGVNMVKSYGGVDSGNQEIDEAAANLQLIETFRKPKYEKLLPKFRIEGMKLLEYFSYALQLLAYKDTSGKAINKYDGYPRYAHCHPTDGTTINISYDGSICSCNWFQGKNLSFGNIFSKPDFEGLAKAHNVNVMDNEHCSSCEIATTCGGGCLNDQHEMGKPAYYQKCKKQSIEIQQKFLEAVFKERLADASLGGAKFKVLSSGFDFDYKYENRQLLQPSG